MFPFHDIPASVLLSLWSWELPDVWLQRASGPCVTPMHCNQSKIFCQTLNLYLIILYKPTAVRYILSNQQRWKGDFLLNFYSLYISLSWSSIVCLQWGLATRTTRLFMRPTMLKRATSPSTGLALPMTPLWWWAAYHDHLLKEKAVKTPLRKGRKKHPCSPFPKDHLLPLKSVNSSEYKKKSWNAGLYCKFH